MGGKSSSSSASTTETVTQDQRVGAEGNAIAVGAGGSFINEFPDEARAAVEDAFNAVIQTSSGSQQFASDVLQGGQTLASESINLAAELATAGIRLASQTTATAGSSLAIVAERQKQDETGAQLQDILPFIGVGGGLLVLYKLLS
jgi:ABC-type molybdate transport system substrate-binding protein